MTGITEEKAIEIARIKLGIPEFKPGRAWLVRRLDRPSEVYYLVEMGDHNAAVGVATVDANTGEIGIYASLPGVGSHLVVDAQKAMELLGREEVAQAELVWMPCKASKSPLYPLWEVRTPRGVRFVDQGKRVLETLEPAWPGG